MFNPSAELYMSMKMEHLSNLEELKDDCSELEYSKLPNNPKLADYNFALLIEHFGDLNGFSIVEELLKEFQRGVVNAGDDKVFGIDEFNDLLYVNCLFLCILRRREVLLENNLISG